jgi:uncharacterized protein (TIGR02466 family)
VLWAFESRGSLPAKPWFPTYIYEAPLLRKGSCQYARALQQECLDLRERDAEGLVWCRKNYPQGYTSYGTLRNLHRTSAPFIALEQKIWPHVARFASRIDMDLREVNLAMVDCWVNIMARGSRHGFHEHPGAVLSGSFYVSAPSDCAGLRFQDPRLEKFANTPPRRRACRPSNQREVDYDVQAGKLILFESWLRHGVEPSATTEERISISFNYAWV